jgi:DNA-binding LacI/PurR family transcriptional regulator
MDSGVKTELVLDFLREKIRNNAFPDGQLPREVDLCAMLGVSRVTVRRALANLSDCGLIIRRRRAGTFVHSKKTETQSVIGIMMRTQGHVYGDMYSCLSEKLSERGFSTQVVSFQGQSHKDRSEQLRQQVLRLLSQPLRGLIVEGYVLGELPSLKGLQKAMPVLWDFFDAPQPIEATGVWFDYAEAGYQAARFLLDHGCRRPMLIIHRTPLQVRFNPVNYQRHREKQVISGYKKAMQEAGLDGDDLIFDPSFYGHKEYDECIIRIMHDEKMRPDGILGSADSLLLRPLKETMFLKLKVPEEILFVGIGNTPWSSVDSIHPFSSIDLQLDATAEKIVEQVLLPPAKRKDVFIKPKLIVRNCSCPGCTGKNEQD